MFYVVCSRNIIHCGLFTNNGVIAMGDLAISNLKWASISFLVMMRLMCWPRLRLITGYFIEISISSIVVVGFDAMHEDHVVS